MLDFLKKKKTEEVGPPDIGKEETLEEGTVNEDGFNDPFDSIPQNEPVKTNKNELENIENITPDIPSPIIVQEKILNKKILKNKLKNSSKTKEKDFNINVKEEIQPPILESSQNKDNPNTNFQKVEAKLEMVNSLINAFNERFSMINQQIGEIRAKSIANEKEITLSNLDAKKVIELVKEVHPEELSINYKKSDLKIASLTEKLDSYKILLDSIMTEIKDLKRKANLFEGTDALLKLNGEVQKDLLEIQKVNNRVKLNADKSEQIFIELTKGFQKNERLKNSMKELEKYSLDIKKEMEGITLDKKRGLNFEQFNELKKKLDTKLISIENMSSEFENLKKTNDKLSNAIEKIIIMEKRNEEDVASLALKKGGLNTNGINYYDKKILSILEIIDKMTIEINKLKKGEKPNINDNSEDLPILQSDIPEEELGKRAGIKNKITENEEKIKELILDGKNSLDKGDVTQATKIYQELFNLYNPLFDVNKRLYYQIVNFYDSISGLVNQPAVFYTKEQEPSSSEKKFKKLEDY